MKILTIEREYGSGGTQIARELAERCHIPCYGEEILQEAAKNLNTAVSDIRSYEEKATSSILYSLFMLSQSQQGNSSMLSNAEKVFVEEQAVIRKIAEHSKGIFIGHCAAEALKEKDIIKVFIYADKDFKRKRILEDYGINTSSIDAAEKKNNKRRSNYYYANTQKKWDDHHNYDIVLNSSNLGIEGCVNVLAGLYKER